MLHTKQIKNKDLSAAVTGLRDGDVLLGRLSSNNDALVRVGFEEPDRQFAPPSLTALNKAFAPENRAATLATLRTLPRFRALRLGDTELEQHLRNEASQATYGPVKMFDNVFESIPGLTVQFITLGTPDGNKPQHLLNGRMATVDEQAQLLAFETPQSYQRVVLAIAPNMRTTDTDGANKILVTTLDQWVPVAYEHTTRGTFDGLVFNLARGTVRTVSERDGALYLYHLQPYPDQPALVLEEFDGIQGPWPTLRELAQHWDRDMIPPQTIDKAEPILRDLTLGALKSLMQKLVRFRPEQVRMPAAVGDGDAARSVVVSGRHLLILTVLVAATHRGTFVPDQQMFQSGAHATAKRLLVMMYEDARPSSAGVMRSLALSAMLGQFDPEWRPSLSLLRQWVDAALSAYGTSEYLPTPTKAYPAIAWTTGVAAHATNTHAFLSVLLDAMGSFEGDKQLLRQAAAVGLELKVRDHKYPAPSVMPFWHYLDQHVDANIVYCFDGSILDATLGARSAGHGPYDVFFGELFRQVTGVNSRHNRVDAAEYEARSLVAAHRQAARRLYVGKRQKAVLPAMIIDPDERVYEYALEDAWLSAMIGQLQVRVGTANYYVLLDTSDITNTPDVIRCPKRSSDSGGDTEPIPMQIVEKAVAAGHALLEQANGYILSACDPPDAKFKGARVRRRVSPEDGELIAYDVKLAYGDAWVPWEQARLITRRLNVTGELPGPRDSLSGYMTGHALDRLLELGHRQRSDIYVGADDLLDRTAARLPRQSLQRLLQWLRLRGNVIQVPNVTRDVGAAKEALSVADPAAYRLLCAISMMYPAALTLELRSVTRFVVKEPLVIWDVTRRLERHVRVAATGSTAGGWPAVESIQLREHQQSAVNDMSRTMDAGLPGRILWMSVGGGKTRTAAGVISMLHQRQQLPRYIIYVGPREALPGNRDELSRLGFPTRLIMDKKETKANLVPNAVVFIQSELLRVLTDQLESLAPDALVILDELHMYMDPTTHRTQAGTMLAVLSHLFLGMTGTLVTDNNPMTFGRWIGYLVPFPVTRRNVWVAALSISHYEIAPPAIAEHHTVEFPASDLPDEYYRQLPERFGGQNTRSSPDLFYGLFEHCYQQSYAVMIDMAVDILLQSPDPNAPVLKRYADWGGRAHAIAFVVRRQADVPAVKQRLIKAALEAGAIQRATQVGVLGEGGLNHLTDRDCEGTTADAQQWRAMRVVILTSHMDKGFELSRCDYMLLSVYFSRLAKRRQREGRINRIGQQASHVHYVTVHGGLLTRTLQYYNEASSMEQAMMQLAQ